MKRIRKESLKQVLKTWAEKYKVIAPRLTERGECMFDSFDEACFTLDYAKPSLPPKHSLFPQSETVFQVDKGSYRQIINRDSALLFGIRSCDLKGMLQSFSFMSKDMDDPFYTTRAENIVTVVMACPGSQSPTCFCTTTQSGPWAESGFDLQLYADGDSFLVEIGSARGNVLASLKEFEETDEQDTGEKIRSFRTLAAGRIPVIPEVAEAMDRLQAGIVPDEVWDRFGMKCITCGGCSFVCPTCTCFTVSDKVFEEGSGERVRSWDTCLYAGFTKEASGHNPRHSQALRIKRRHEHKLLYHADREKYGGLCTCVGCGRCSDYCPVHIGALEVARSVSSKRSD